MGYLFLTGATGLLGAYLIRELMARGVQMAVLVRGSRRASAQARIETLIAHWEQAAGHALPRPVVLEGDLSNPVLGLSQADRNWVAWHCDSLMHNAASLTFVAESPADEPWRSNLHGTRHVLEFCRNTGIRRFHHVSTAYVCGLRTDRVFERDVDVGQELGNDYEKSKLQSEKMVREADFLDRLTVYRPAIIFGDSKTGYTSTYHGFYVPLKLVSTLISKTASLGIPHEMMEEIIRASGARLREILNFTGDERKNYVPVDWVSEAMARIYIDPALHGETYHLTPRAAVPISLSQRVLEQAYFQYAKLSPPQAAAKGTVNWEEFERFFIDGMSVYRSYWRNDPEFDSTNTQRALPDLPCPDPDEAMLMQMCRFAIEANFGWPVPPIVKPRFNVHRVMEPLVTSQNGSADGNGEYVYLGLQVNGQGGGQWELAMKDGKIVAAGLGLGQRATATFYLNSTTFEELSTRAATVEQAINQGRLLIEGNGVPLSVLAGALGTVVTAHADAARQA